MLAVLLVDLGIAAAAVGLLAAIRPIRFLRLAPRRRGLAVAAGGGGLVALGMLLPAPLERAPSIESGLDRMLPAWQFAERHERTIAVDPARVDRAIREVTAGEIRGFRTLTWLRSPRPPGSAGPESILAPSPTRPILDVALGSGFVELVDEPRREMVIGTLVIVPDALLRKSAAELETLAADFTADRFAALDEPGYAKAAMNFRLEPASDGATRLITETRVYATDAATRRRFAVYWRLIYPGSAFLRRQWLAAIAARAEGPPPAGPAAS